MRSERTDSGSVFRSRPSICNTARRSSTVTPLTVTVRVEVDCVGPATPPRSRLAESTFATPPATATLVSVDVSAAWAPSASTSESSDAGLICPLSSGAGCGKAARSISAVSMWSAAPVLVVETDGALRASSAGSTAGAPSNVWASARASAAR